jgi:hypothetical protein
LHGITAVGFDAVASLFGNEGGRDNPAVITFVGQVAVEPVAAWSGFIDKDEVLGLGLQFADELIDVAVAGADGPVIDDLGVVIFGDLGDRNSIFVDIQTNVECARVCHG